MDLQAEDFDGMDRERPIRDAEEAGISDRGAYPTVENTNDYQLMMQRFNLLHGRTKAFWQRFRQDPSRFPNPR